MAEIKYVKDHKSGNRFYPIVKSAGIIDAFNINEPQIDCLFGKVQSVSFANSSVSLNLNESAQLQLNLTSLGTVDHDDFQWESSHPEVATVDKGLVTAVSKGSTTIRAYSPFYEREGSMQIFVALDPNDINKGTPTWYIKYKAKEPSRFLYFGIKNWESETEKNLLSAGLSADVQLKGWFSGELTSLTEFSTIPMNLVQDLYDPDTQEGIIGFNDACTVAVPIVHITGTVDGTSQSADTMLPWNGYFTASENQLKILPEIDQNITHLDLPADKAWIMLFSAFVPFGALESLTFRGNISVGDFADFTSNIDASAPIFNQIFTIKSDQEYSSFYRGLYDLGGNDHLGYFKGIEVETGHQSLDSRDNCNAVIETATNTLIIGTPSTQIPSSVTALNRGAFIYVKMESLVIPESVTTIGTECFCGAEITNLTIPATAYVDMSAFLPSSTIQNIYYGGTMEQWQNMNVTLNYPAPTIHCSDGTI